MSKKPSSRPHKRKRNTFDNEAKWEKFDYADDSEGESENDSGDGSMDGAPRSSAFWKLQKMGILEKPKKKRRLTAAKSGSDRKKGDKTSEYGNDTESDGGIDREREEQSESEDGSYWDPVNFCRICRQKGHTPIECDWLHGKGPKSKTKAESKVKPAPTPALPPKGADFNEGDGLESKLKLESKGKHNVKQLEEISNQKQWKAKTKKVLNPVEQRMVKRIGEKEMDKWQRAEERRKGKLHSFVDDILVDKVGVTDLDRKRKSNVFHDKRKKAKARKRYGKRKS